ncbi:MAG TPA: hypothetical protein VKA96_01675 [Solirubrobacteraceae bacterium]|nr:hypothetical protein [Solirubrobacteraceae bacterium]
MAARRAGRLPTRDQWRRSQPDAGSGWRSLAARLLGRPRPER